ncbi:MAG: FG-GAP repeat protein [Deltaproteobacteria bacterium]|nr:FG-GAP repeat protein [Deltaproteobacteria bacterium]
MRLSPMFFFAALSVSGCLTSPAEYKELLAAAKDHDGDGFVNVDYDGDDCDDDRADVNPGAEEVCDGADNNCDGETDEGFDTSWYEDHDEDGYAAAAPITACEAPSAEATQTPGADCDDLDASVSPDAVEVCDGQDNNCDGRLDEQEAIDASLWHRDEDGDGFGQDTAPLRACEALDGTVAQAGDCDDGDATVNPGAAEVCDDGLDNNCDESASPCAFSGDYDLNDADVIFTGESGDEAGWAMCGGDLNHDGADDLAIGAPGADRVYVVYGPLTPGEHKLSDADLTLSGSSGSELGYALLCTDLNDDGGADLAVGAPGDSEVTLWFGPLGTGKKSSTAAGNTFSSSQDRYGASLAGGLDDGEDEDGDADLFVGVDADYNDGERGIMSIIWGPLESAKYTYSVLLGDGPRDSPRPSSPCPTPTETASTSFWSVSPAMTAARGGSCTCLGRRPDGTPSRAKPPGVGATAALVALRSLAPRCTSPI